MKSGGIGIDIGGTHVKAVLVSGAGEILSRMQSETGDADNAWQSEIVPIVDRFEKQHGAVTAVGISAPGIGRPDERGISWMIGRMASVVNFDFTSHLHRPAPVPVLNDALAALLGEAWIGAARGVQDAVLLTLDTGAPSGDAMVKIEGMDTPVSPGSTVGGCLLINSIKAEVALRLTQAGHPPKVLSGAAIVGAERARALFESAYDEHAHRIAKLYATVGQTEELL
jgi:hypothetical protein